MTDLAINGLSYRYGRSAEALHDVTLTVPGGAIYGLLGANGAGKTTLLQCCAGLRTPDAGRVLIGGENSVRRGLIVTGVVGYVAAGMELPRDLTLQELGPRNRPARDYRPVSTRADAGPAVRLLRQNAPPCPASVGARGLRHGRRGAFLRGIPEDRGWCPPGVRATYRRAVVL